MLKKYRNEIYEAINSTVLYSGDFTIKESDDNFLLVYKPQPKLEFRIKERENSHHAFRAQYVNFEKGYPLSPDVGFSNFATVMTKFKYWLKSIIEYNEEAETVDLWSFDLPDDDQPKLLATSFSTIDFESDAPFTEEEARLLRGDMNSAYEHIKSTLEIESDRLSKIEDALKELSDKIDQLGKSNWKQQAGEIMKDVIVDAAKDSFQLKSLIEIFSNLWETGMIFLS
jgi:hypothetical protein